MTDPKKPRNIDVPKVSPRCRRTGSPTHPVGGESSPSVSPAGAAPLLFPVSRRDLHIARERLGWIEPGQGFDPNPDARPPEGQAATARPSPPSVRRWARRLEQGDGDIRALVPPCGARGSHTPRFPVEVEHILDETVRRLANDAAQPSARVVADHVAMAVLDLSRATGQALAVPSLTTVRRRLARLARTEELSGRRPHALQGAGSDARKEQFPYDRVEIGVARLAPAGLSGPGRRPVFAAVASDLATSVVAGVAASDEPSEDLLLEILEQIVHAKTYSPAAGVPRVIVLESGRFLNGGRSLRDAAAALGISLVSAPPGRGRTERRLASLANALAQGTGGRLATGLVPGGLPDEPDHMLLAAWAATFNRTVGPDGRSPDERWRAAAAIHPPVPTAPGMPAGAGGAWIERRITPRGIEVNGLLYRCPGLMRHRHRGGRVLVRIDPSDTSYILLREPGGGRTQAVPLVDGCGRARPVRPRPRRD